MSSLTIIKIGRPFYRATFEGLEKWRSIWLRGELPNHESSGEVVTQRLDLPDDDFKITFVDIPGGFHTSPEDILNWVDLIKEEISNSETPTIFVSSNVDFHLTLDGLSITQNHDK